MTVAANSPLVQYLENGSTTVWTVPFRYLDPADLVVTRISATGAVTTLVLNTDYTATTGPTDAGGMLTTTAAAAVGVALNIVRHTARTQPDGYPTGDTFPAATLERDLDRVIMIAQEMDVAASGLTGRALVLPVGDTANTTLPTVSARAGAVLGFDASGNPLAVTYPASAALAAGIFATSTATIAIGTGSKSFTASTASLLVVGQWVTMASTASPANYMNGQITAYNPATGAMTINMVSTGGSGSFANWTISISAPGANSLLLTGGTLSGKLNTVASAAGGAGLNVAPGVAPTSPLNGDVWVTSTVAMVRIGGASLQVATLDVVPTTAAMNTAIAGSQLQQVSATVAASALTIGFTPGPGLEFRDPTLTSGATHGWTSSTPVSLTVPSGATLGMTNGVQANLMIVMLYNGGNPVPGIVNIGTAINLDECGLLTSTTMSAASDSAGVVYSASAVANSPYRVVGLVQITQATAGTWATAPTLVQGQGGEALTALQAAGMGQKWTNMSGSRALSTNYTNNGLKQIGVKIVVSGTVSRGYIIATVAGEALTTMPETLNWCQIDFTVDPGETYSVAMNSGSATISQWKERV